MEQSVQEMKLPPIFERHQRDLIALLQRPVVHGGAGLSQQAAAEAYRSTVVDLTKDVNKALQTHRFLTDPVVFHMHVCTVLWELTSSKSTSPPIAVSMIAPLVPISANNLPSIP